MSVQDVNNLGHPATMPVSRPSRPGWLARHQRYCELAAAGGIDLVFLGDSLTQRWEGAADVWRQYYGARRAVQMGIDNDGTQQVIWRLDHGTLAGLRPQLVVLLIGINNIGNDNAGADEVTAGVTAIVSRIQSISPATNVLILGLLPHHAPGVDDAECIRQTNQRLAALADRDRVYFIDFGSRLLVDGKVDGRLQPDGTHLSAAGYRIFADAIEPMLTQLLKNSEPQGR